MRVPGSCTKRVLIILVAVPLMSCEATSLELLEPTAQGLGGADVALGEGVRFLRVTMGERLDIGTTFLVPELAEVRWRVGTERIPSGGLDGWGRVLGADEAKNHPEAAAYDGDATSTWRGGKRDAPYFLTLELDSPLAEAEAIDAVDVTVGNSLRTPAGLAFDVSADGISWYRTDDFSGWSDWSQAGQPTAEERTRRFELSPLSVWERVE